ncbi:RNA 3'-terminal phosphate cyclase [Dendrothele bispora CBS 962.96]|uniref:RNA 3'-terminal phosphate cyclase n=1 Tax=Dendrothele bispora (strain CBS 962.96) TaxID=1314807 RepID=A0A4S8MXC5_DENBC|nr:RNA 3'-terminal phosphate cyclase [Dendrothele bispora CBS 962.96]
MPTTSIIDGSVLEGGGQILRNSISLSALLGRPISIQKIRNGRTPPGLKNQHRTGLVLAAEISSAQLTGAGTGSSQVDFIPGRIRPGNYLADSITAGATTLLLQVAFPLLLFGATPSTLVLKGGTNCEQAPQIDYIQHVFFPFVKKHFGVSAELEIYRRGYYPKGGGEIRVNVTPVKSLQSFSLLERGQVVRVRGIAHLAKLPGHLGQSMVEGAKKRLATGGIADTIPIEIEYKREENDNAVGAGSGIVLWAELDSGGIIGGSAVGRKGLDATQVGEEAAKEVLKGLEAGGCTDEWLTDQIVLFMALSQNCEVLCGEITLHTRTAIWIAEQLTDAKFEIEEKVKGNVIRCQGIGMTSVD